MKKERNIKAETVLKTQKYLNHLLTHINANNGDADSRIRKNMANNYGQPYGLFKEALKLGYFEQVSKSKYKSKYVKFEPIHARTVLVNQYQTHDEALKRKPLLAHSNVDKQKKNVVKANPISVKYNDNQFPLAPETVLPRQMQRDISRNNKKRTVSIFWGLLKFNY